MVDHNLWGSGNRNEGNSNHPHLHEFGPSPSHAMTIKLVWILEEPAIVHWMLSNEFADQDSELNPTIIMIDSILPYMEANS